MSYSKPCEWEGVRYESIREAAEATGIDYSTLVKWIHKGRSTRSHKRSCIWNGIHYNSIKEAAEANFITPVGMWFRIVRNGYTCDDDMRHLKGRAKK